MTHRNEQNKEEIVHVRFSDKVFDLIDAECKRLGMKRTEFVRYALVRYFETPQTQEHPYRDPNQLEFPEGPPDAA